MVAQGNLGWLGLIGLSLGSAFHFHFAAFYLVIFVLLSLLYIRPPSARKLFLALVLFLFMLSPLFLFETRHQFLISKQLIKLLTLKVSGETPFLLRFLKSTYVAMQSFIYLWVPHRLGIVVVALLIISQLALIIKKKVTQKSFGDTRIFILLVLLLSSAAALTALVDTQPVPYYFMPLFPTAFLLLGLFHWRLFKAGGLYFIFGVALIIFATSLNLHQLIKRRASISLWTKKQAVRAIMERSQDKSFRLSVVADLGWDNGFDYLFLKEGISQPRSREGPVFTIVVPYNYQGIQPDLTFGDVGVVLPEDNG
jgi:4-amino-4-deoxy-L-arabinose transferase-like glycosyltransferase